MGLLSQHPHVDLAPLANNNQNEEEEEEEKTQKNHNKDKEDPNVLNRLDWRGYVDHLMTQVCQATPSSPDTLTTATSSLQPPQESYVRPCRRHDHHPRHHPLESFCDCSQDSSNLCGDTTDLDRLVAQHRLDVQFGLTEEAQTQEEQQKHQEFLRAIDRLQRLSSFPMAVCSSSIANVWPLWLAVFRLWRCGWSPDPEESV